MLRYFNLWLSIGWLMVIAICYVSLTPSPPEFNINVAYLDKMEHFISYFILMFWFSQLYETNKSRLLYVLSFIFMGIAIEVLQGLGGVRYFEYYDMLANTLGIITAWFITKGRFKFLLLSCENRFLNKTI